MAQQTVAQREHTKSIVEKFQKSQGDTGSAEVQVALLTDRINELTEHLRTHQKDFSTQRGLLKLVGRRRDMLNFLKDTSPDRYMKLISDLELRK